MILIHCWEEEEPEDMHLRCVVDILLDVYQAAAHDVDVREHSNKVSHALKVAVRASIAKHAFGGDAKSPANVKSQ